jgi:hypothetical protein
MGHPHVGHPHMDPLPGLRRGAFVLAKSRAWLSSVGITDDFVGGSFCRPSGTLFLLILTYPGLTSGTTSCRRSGAGVGWRLARASTVESESRAATCPELVEASVRSTRAFGRKREVEVGGPQHDLAKPLSGSMINDNRR